MPVRVMAAALAGLLIATALWRLEAQRAGLERTHFRVDATPVTLTAQPDADGPLVVVSHGFAGSRPLMEAYTLTLARAGYRVAAFDYEGHGRNTAPMAGDLEAVDGATARLMAETRRVIAAARARTGADGPIALLGHSMATDVIIRDALAHDDVAAVVAVSMYSEAVSPSGPERLLAVNGALEGRLREEGLRVLRALDPGAEENQTVEADSVLRRVAVAPGVEHVGVLYSPTALREARAWLDAAFGRDGDASRPVTSPGPWLLGLLAGIVALGWPLARALPPRASAPEIMSPARFAIATLAPAAVTPLVLAPLQLGLLPVLVADYLAAHLLVFGVLQSALLWRFGARPSRAALGRALVAGVLLAGYGIGAFGLALDRYGASFMPHAGRLAVIAAIAAGAIPFMLADQLVVRGEAWRALAARIAFFASIALAVALRPAELFFLIIAAPVIVLFFAVFGLLGAWTGRRAGPEAAGLGLGLLLAWSLGVTFPLFSAALG